VRMVRDSVAYRWRYVARDGADPPATQVALMTGFPAAPGSTRDFEITLPEPGELGLSVDAFSGGAGLLRKPVLVKFRVRAP
jgi:hypothetical protein